MANCIVNLLRAIWSFIIGSLRMILFFGCLLSLLIQIAHVYLLIRVTADGGRIEMPNGTVGLDDYGIAFGLLILSLVGCYGAFYRHHQSVKIFSVMTGVMVTLMIVMIIYTMSPGRIAEQNEKFIRRFKDFMDDYSWDADSRSEATVAWNKLQKLMCCGLKGPDDWASRRPKDFPNKSYPSSCCFMPVKSVLSGESYCKYDVFETGCQEQVLTIQKISEACSYLFVVFHLALAVFSWVVGNCHLDAQRPAHQAGSATNNRSGNMPTEYQRFEGSVYVRQQPAYEQQYTPSAKPHAPPLYPNIGDVEKSAYAPPPPSYGTSA